MGHVCVACTHVFHVPSRRVCLFACCPQHPSAKLVYSKLTLAQYVQVLDECAELLYSEVQLRSAVGGLHLTIQVRASCTTALNWHRMPHTISGSRSTIPYVLARQAQLHGLMLATLQMMRIPCRVPCFLLLLLLMMMMCVRHGTGLRV